MVKLGAVFDIQQGKALSRRNNKGIRPRPFLRTANILWGSIDLSRLDYMDFTEKEEQKYRLQPGDLLVCEGGDVGRTAIWEGQLDGVYYQNHLHRLRPKVLGVEPLFVMYWMQAAITLFNLYLGSSNKTTIANLSRSRLADFDILLPPLPEQRAIAHVLRTVQRNKEATEQVIAALKELKKSLMRHLFTYGPVPVDHTDRVEMQETEIGPLPRHWKAMRLGEVASLKLGRTPARKQMRYWQQGQVPWVSISDLNNGVVTTTKERISNEAFREVFESVVVPVGSLLLSFKLTIGKVGILGIPAVHNEAIASIFPDEHKALRDFLFFLFQSLDYDALLDSYVKGKTLNKRKLIALPIRLPPLPEQRKIAHILQTVDRKIEAEENRKEALEALFKSLLHDLMTAKRRLPPDFIARFKD